MTYHTLKCPHCGNVVNRATGSPSYIGNPFRKCPMCGGVYVDSFTREWVTKSPFQRIWFLVSKPLSFAFLSIIVVALLMVYLGVDIMIAISVGVAVAVLICVVGTFIQKSSLQETINESIKRTKSASYVKSLQNAGFKIYHIKGAEIGTIHDEQGTNLLSEEVKKETDSFYTLH